MSADVAEPPPSGRLARLWRGWCSYWFAPGGQLAAAVLRIAIAIASLWMIWRIADSPTTSSEFYYRHGVWLLLPGRPSAALIAAVQWIAIGSTIAMLLGIWSRGSHAISAIACAAIAAYAGSDTATWSHDNVPPMLASLALLGARSGDALSIDAWLRSRRRNGRIAAGGDYLRSVRLVQLAVAAVFVLAAYEKLRSGGPSLAWALSDNLRNQILTRYDWIGLPRTPLAQWLLGAAWRYELCACLNLISQLSPVLAVIFVRRPWIRALSGAMWCAEVLGLGLTMDLWNWHWLPLAAAFVDWDAVAARLGARRAPVALVRSRGGLAFTTAFVAVFAVQALWLNQRLQLYPFSGFPLFASVRAKRPYSRHQPYDLEGGRIEPLTADHRTGSADAEAWIARRNTYRWLWRERRPDRLRGRLTTVLGDVQKAWPGAAITGLRQWLSVYRAPAYPEPARLDRLDLAIVAELDGGELRSELGALLPDGRTWLAPDHRVPPAGTQLFALPGEDPEPVPVAAEPTPTGFVLAAPLAGDPVYLIGKAPGDGHAWLLAFRSHRGY